MAIGGSQGETEDRCAERTSPGPRSGSHVCQCPISLVAHSDANLCRLGVEVRVRNGCHRAKMKVSAGLLARAALLAGRAALPRVHTQPPASWCQGSRDVLDPGGRAGDWGVDTIHRGAEHVLAVDLSVLP